MNVPGIKVSFISCMFYWGDGIGGKNFSVTKKGNSSTVNSKWVAVYFYESNEKKDTEVHAILEENKIKHKALTNILLVILTLIMYGALFITYFLA